MEKENSGKLLELNDMQLKISYLFKDLMREKNDYKQKSENMSKKLKQIYDEVHNLKNKVESFKKQSEALKLNYEDMKSVIERGVKFFRSLDLSQGCLVREQRIMLETLKTFFFECSTKLENYEILHEVWQNGENIEKEFERFSNFNHYTDIVCDRDFCKNSPKESWILKKSNSDTILKPVFSNKYEEPKHVKQSASGDKNETVNSEFMTTIIDATDFKQPSPEISQTENQCNKSPVFKDFGVRRQESLSREENNSTSMPTLSTKLINEKFLEKSDDFIISPWKKSPPQAKEKSPSTPKAVKRQLKISSPDRSPLLKKSNTREAEISFSGIKKLRQTFLNLDCYKKKGGENRENENLNSKDEVKANIEDDDIITDSPKKVEQPLEDVRNKKSGKNLLEAFLKTPPQAPDDLDETYISSSVVRKCNLKKQHELERVIEEEEEEEEAQLKRPARKKSPEYDSVPFVYKREPIRKKAERMKLPGHACAECNKYYENAFDDIETQDLKKILNKCSRHRDKNSPALDDTPPGYWKPFLTCSTVMSPNKNDNSKIIINPEKNHRV